jgi:TPR repeat protein
MRVILLAALMTLSGVAGARGDTAYVDPAAGPVTQALLDLARTKDDPGGVAADLSRLAERRSSGTASTPDLFKLALATRYGLGIDPRPSEGCLVLGQLAEGGHVPSMYAYATCFTDGTLTTNAGAAAVRWYTAAAEAGSEISRCAIGEMYLSGTLIEKDETRGMALCRQAAEAGAPPAQITVAERLIPPSRPRAERLEGFEWLDKAAAQGEAKAHFYIAVRHLNGDETPKDPDEAVASAERAARKNLDIAYSLLSTLGYMRLAEGGQIGSGNLSIDEDLARRTYYFLARTAAGRVPPQYRSQAQQILAQLRQWMPPPVIAEWDRLADLGAAEFLDRY